MAYFFEGKILAFYIVIFAAFLLIYGIGRRKTELPVYIVTGVIFGIYLYFLIRVPVIRSAFPGAPPALSKRSSGIFSFLSAGGFCLSFRIPVVE